NGGTGAGCPSECDPVHVGITELTTGYRWGSQAPSIQSSFTKPQGSNNFSQRLSVAYVTGSHSFKAGVQLMQGRFENYGFALPNGYDEVYQSGSPLLLNEYAAPFQSVGLVRRQSLFAQDQWTVKKFTVNLGLRFDHFYVFTPADTIPAGRFTIQ